MDDDKELRLQKYNHIAGDASVTPEEGYLLARVETLLASQLELEHYMAKPTVDTAAKKRIAVHLTR